MTERERMIREIIGPAADGLRITTDAEGRLVYSMPRKKSKRRERRDGGNENGGGTEMTIGGWLCFVFFAALLIFGAFLVFISSENLAVRITVSALCGLAVIGLLVGLLWYFGNTASGQRAMVDQQSDLGNGLDRIVRVYTANGDIIAEFEGTIDIEGNDGGYVLFDYQGKRYTYYNCFVESIAEIGE